jgi:quercetin dioxygenase-like cupin family protein
MLARTEMISHIRSKHNMSETIYYPAGPGSKLDNEHVPKRDIGGGILLQIIGEGEQLNAVHWNLPDGSIVPRHSHPQEQFGYVIKGAFEVTIFEHGQFVVKEGDSYVIPSNAEH